MSDGLKLLFTLVGRTTKKNITTTNKEAYEGVKSAIGFHFGNCPLYFVDNIDLDSEYLTYPAYFSAGWYVGGEDKVTEMVLIAHGSSMKNARQSMLTSAEKLNLKSYVGNI